MNNTFEFLYPNVKIHYKLYNLKYIVRLYHLEIIKDGGRNSLLYFFYYGNLVLDKYLFLWGGIRNSYINF